MGRSKKEGGRKTNRFINADLIIIVVDQIGWLREN